MKLFFFLAAGCLLPLAASQAPSAGRKTPEEMARKKAEYQKEHPPRQSVGLTPLTDLGKGSYKGEQGGLYPGGENVTPPEHLKAGLKLARMVVPRNADGNPASDGKIVLVCDFQSSRVFSTSAASQKAAAWEARSSACGSKSQTVQSGVSRWPG